MAASESLTIETLDEPGTRRAQALRLILAVPGESTEEADRRVALLEEYVAAQSLSWGPVLGAASGSGPLISAAMVIESPGRLGAVFVPADRTADQVVPATVLLLRRLQEASWQRSLAMLQALVDLDDRARANVYPAAGFEFLADLIYLERSASAPCPRLPGLPGLEFAAYTPAGEDEFAEVLELTYRHSRDCPKLTGVRRPDEVLATHRATGLHDPAWWMIAKLDGQPAGVLLLAGVHGRGALEVVYMGVVPAFRGQGVGHAILDRAVETCRQHNNAYLTLAVDRLNAPARRLYRRWSFGEVVRRRAWFVPSPHRG